MSTVPLVNAIVVPVTEPPRKEFTVNVAIFPFVAIKFEANKLVEVVLVPVAFVQERLVKLDGADPVTVKLTMVALVANRFVVVASLDTKLGAFKLTTVPVNAFMVVPEAVANPSQPVDVPFANVRLVAVPLVVTMLLTNKLVPVALVNSVF